MSDNMIKNGMDMKAGQTEIERKIGEDYKCWGNNVLCDDLIFISAPTGSGKTTFVFRELARWALSSNERILYFVNRRILYQQLIAERESVMNELDDEYAKNNGIPYDLHRIDDVILIATYQSLEKVLRMPKTSQERYTILRKYQECKYIVMDEAHYFMADSLFNPDTYNSFIYLMKLRKGEPGMYPQKSNCVKIMISATIEPIKDYVKRNIDALVAETGIRYVLVDVPIDLADKYKDMKIHVLQTDEELGHCIKLASDEKWLIFVDSKKRGNEIYNVLTNEDNKISCVYIDAEYQKDVETKSTVEQIVTDRKIKENVCITTYVLDNGVSIEDNRNRIVIYADNEVEFLQCLGRVRTIDYRGMHLYLPKGRNQDFQERLKSITDIIKECRKWRKSYIRGTDNSVWIDTWAEFVKYLLENESAYHVAQRVCYSTSAFYNYLAVSPLSMQQCQYLRKNYIDICNELKNDEFAFVKKQIKWLNRTDRVEDCIEGNLLKNEIILSIESVLGSEMSTDVAGHWYNSIRETMSNYLNYKMLLKGDFEKKNENPFRSIIGSLGKSCSSKAPQIISGDNFEKLMNYIELPYRLKRKNKKVLISLAENEI